MVDDDSFGRNGPLKGGGESCCRSGSSRSGRRRRAETGAAVPGRAGARAAGLAALSCARDATGGRFSAERARGFGLSRPKRAIPSPTSSGKLAETSSLDSERRHPSLSQTHSRGVRRTSISRPSSVPSPPMSVQYSHRAVVGRLIRMLQCAVGRRLESACFERVKAKSRGGSTHDSTRAPGTRRPNWVPRSLTCGKR
jgi:hypothetical protein